MTRPLSACLRCEAWPWLLAQNSALCLGHALEHLAMDRARHAIEALASLAPKIALVVRDGIKFEMAVEELQRGDHVLVRPGQRIPADGKVVEGASAVDQAAITGESMPVDKTVESQVFAGTVNGEGLLRVEVTKLAKGLPQNPIVEESIKLFDRDVQLDLAD